MGLATGGKLDDEVVVEARERSREVRLRMIGRSGPKSICMEMGEPSKYEGMNRDGEMTAEAMGVSANVGLRTVMGGLKLICTELVEAGEGGFMQNGSSEEPSERIAETLLRSSQRTCFRKRTGSMTAR